MDKTLSAQAWRADIGALQMDTQPCANETPLQPPLPSIWLHKAWAPCRQTHKEHTMRFPNKSTLTLSAVTLSLLASTIVLAQTPPPAVPGAPSAMQARIQERLKAADTNNDGLISKAE